MAIEAMVLQHDLFGYNSKDLYNLLGGNWGCDFGLVEKEEEEKKVTFDNILVSQTENYHYASWNSPPPSVVVPHLDQQWGPNSSLEPHIGSTIIPQEFPQVDTSPTMSTRPKRRRSKSKKNKEEIENQRMTHIAVERNRRKQMNEYLSVLRALMPDCYSDQASIIRGAINYAYIHINIYQDGDQASIIGGAINYVKELEQRLHSLVGRQKFEAGSSSAFAEFFTFPQYSTKATHAENSTAMDDLTAQNHSAIADIEVTMVESHVNLKIRSKKRPKQLLKMVSGLQSLRLTILHLNVTTMDQIVLYSLSVKVEDDCKLTSVDEIATAVNQMLGLVMVRFTGSSLTVELMKIPKEEDDWRNHNRKEKKLYIVGSLGKLLLIERTYSSKQTVKMEVFELDISRREWVRVKILGDVVLFVGDNYCCGLPLKLGGGGRFGENCIYFADHYNKYPVVFHDIGAYDISDTSIEHLILQIIDFWEEKLLGSHQNSVESFCMFQKSGSEMLDELCI
ncbi:hypothetical protein F0562_029373 [Nyssa sinensis]|uniref:BHLH domain-containing protein n=1 Tax=Nyssa sinensis TaxID=561372 RepID=A0A5J5B0V6_9ASTE|nr:hypothetical protein F0562_029373 [Nyssa sinensis]